MDAPDTTFAVAALVLVTGLVVAQSGIGDIEPLLQLIQALVDLFTLLSELLGGGLLTVVTDSVVGSL